MLPIGQRKNLDATNVKYCLFDFFGATKILGSIRWVYFSYAFTIIGSPFAHVSRQFTLAALDTVM
jgi:hypothetical protein